MKLTVLGKYGPYPGAGGACSGYLVEEGQTKVLIDCGNGVLSRLQKICGIRELTAIVLSHLHSDHISDIMVLRYGLDILRKRGLYDDKPLKVYAPQNPEKDYKSIGYKDVYELIPINNNTLVSMGELSFKFKEMTHPIQSFAMDISNGDKRLIYTGDTGYNEEIVSFAQNADFLLADTGLLEKDNSGNGPHMSADEVGRIAVNANVSKLMLTHIWPQYSEDDIASEAKRHYKDAIVAQEMKSYYI